LLIFGAVSAFGQSFDCYNYGSYSQCQMPNGSQITCYNYIAGTHSSCEVTHANGFVSSQSNANASGDAVGPLVLLIAWMAHKHAEHITDKAMENASATVLLTIKHSIHLMDTSALIQRLGPYLPPEQKSLAEQLTKNLAAQSSAFSGAVSYFAANWNAADRSSFYHAAKGLEKLYDSGLLAVCGARAASQMLTGKLDTVRSNLPVELTQVLHAVKGDETLLEPECTSKEAVKLLKKQAEKTKFLQ